MFLTTNLIYVFTFCILIYVCVCVCVYVWAAVSAGLSLAVPAFLTLYVIVTVLDELKKRKKKLIFSILLQIHVSMASNLFLHD